MVDRRPPTPEQQREAEERVNARVKSLAEKLSGQSSRRVTVMNMTGSGSADDFLSKFLTSLGEASTLAKKTGNPEILLEISGVITVDVVPLAPDTEAIIAAMLDGKFKKMDSHEMQAWAGMEGVGYSAEINNHLVAIDLAPGGLVINIVDPVGDLLTVADRSDLFNEIDVELEINKGS